MLGKKLDGRYHVLSKLGSGAMGDVYLVQHILLRRREALKILNKRLAATQQFVSRFRREARATNRLHHPNIVSLYDIGQLPDGHFYITTEYAEGENLGVLLQHTGALPPARVVAILVQLADAVGHAHERGVVHRDIKPDNMILIEHRGKPSTAGWTSWSTMPAWP
ncbi:MAG: serine/threonine protein kinase [Proteobacteria bacterium]|nr:serine/threonine protein kinase [Pseudomonadota bacterium]